MIHKFIEYLIGTAMILLLILCAGFVEEMPIVSFICVVAFGAFGLLVNKMWIEIDE